MTRHRSADFLRPFPPEDSGRLRKLFVDRARERDIISADLVEGFLQARREVSCVAGTSRVGKSHLTRLVAAEVARKKKAVLCEVRIRRDPRDVALEAYRRLQERLQAESARPLEKQPRDAVAAVAAVLASVEPALSSDVREVEIAVTQESVRKLRSQRLYKLGIPTFLAGLLGGFEHEAENERETREQRTRTVRLGRLEVEALCQLVAYAGRCIIECGFAPGIILLLDDFDLFSQEAESGAALRLLNALRPVTEIRSFVVLATVREKFARDHGRDLRTVVTLRGLPERQLVDIYRKHCTLYGVPNDTFSADAVELLAGRCAGRPGWFLSHLNEALEEAAAIAAAGPISADRLLSHLRDARDEMRRLAPELMREVERLVRTGRTELPSDLSIRLRDSALFNRVVYESHRAIGTMEVDPVYLSELVVPDPLPERP